MTDLTPAQTRAPVTYSPGELDDPADGWALCLSGGGYRAMLFHLGTLWRLNDIGFLPRLDRISSVSGGSITAGVLGWHWADLDFDSSGHARGFHAAIVEPLRRFSATTIDVGAGLLGLLSPGSIGEQLIEHYRDHLFGNPPNGPTLQDLPERPRFVLNATNLESGALWRFSRPYMGDYRVGLIKNPRLEVAIAVAASSAFPPFLSPVDLDLDPDSYAPLSGDPKKDPDLVRDGYRASPRLSDGGVYDNLGLETAYKNYRNLLVSDGGGKMGADHDVERDWIRQMMRIGDVVDNQVRSLRKRLLIAAFEAEPPDRNGAYWSLRSELADYPVTKPLLPPDDQVATARSVPTRLKTLDEYTQKSLINWGYCACDLGLRAYALKDEALAEPRLPYP